MYDEEERDPLKPEELGEFEDDEPELAEPEGEWEAPDEPESPYDAEEEAELAAELLEVTDEYELDRFLGKLIRRATRSVRSFVGSPTGRAVGRLLKGAARVALPLAGRAVGAYFGGPVGSAVGGTLASTAGRIFGLELEGLPPEAQEFEVAKHFVRFAGTAAMEAELSKRSRSPTYRARKAVRAAARRHAPGLLKRKRPKRRRPRRPGYPRRTVWVRPYRWNIPTRWVEKSDVGKWIRDGRNVVIINCFPPPGYSTTESDGSVSTTEEEEPYPPVV